MAISNLKIMIIKSNGDIQERTFEKDSIIIGSGASAEIQLDDDKVSSIHAMLKASPDGVRVVDLGSESGTRLRGKVVQEEPLESGDVIEVGQCKIRVTFGEQADERRELTEVVSVPDASDAPGTAEDTGSEEATVEQEALPERPKKVGKKNRKVKKAGSSAPKASPSAGAGRDTFQSTEVVRALQPEGDAMKIFSEEIPESDRPTSSARMLEVVMVWSDTIIGIGHYRMNEKRAEVTLGDGKKNDFHLANDRIPLHRFPFLQREGSEWNIVLAEGMDLKVRDVDGETHTLEELKERGRATRADAEFKGYAYRLALHDQAMIYVDDTIFIVRYVKPSKRIVTNVWETIDFYFTKVLSTSFVAHVLFIAALLFTPINTEELSEDLFKNPNRFAKLIIRPPEKEKKKFKDLSGVEEGAKAKDKEGKFGKKEEIQKEAAPSKKGAPIVDVDKREEDRKKVMKTGLLAALNAPDDGAASNIFGPGGLGTGINNALGGLQGGAGMGDAHGVGGLGSRGTGPGGGGTALGIGGLGTKGGGRGRGGYGSIDLGGRGRGLSKLTSGASIVKGGLDKEVIARIVRRHQNEIKYCYERELQKDPNLYGKVAVLWIISADGAVAKATIAQTTMGNSNVENCILSRVKRWRFPQPKGGGIVQVTYPWIFKPSN